MSKKWTVHVIKNHPQSPDPEMYNLKIRADGEAINGIMDRNTARRIARVIERALNKHEKTRSENND